MSDLNAKVGKGKAYSLVGNFDLGNRNDIGERLIKFSHENKMVITNTFFKLIEAYTYGSLQKTQNIT